MEAGRSGWRPNLAINPSVVATHSLEGTQNLELREEEKVCTSRWAPLAFKNCT